MIREVGPGSGLRHPQSSPPGEDPPIGGRLVEDEGGLRMLPPVAFSGKRAARPRFQGGAALLLRLISLFTPALHPLRGV